MNELFNSLKPKIVLLAPDGQQLWIDPTVSGGTVSAGPSLWPNGFVPMLQFGDTPQTSNVTTSPATFLGSQSWTLLRAPGPLGVPWGLWGVALLTAAALPYIPLILRHHSK